MACARIITSVEEESRWNAEFLYRRRDLKTKEVGVEQEHFADKKTKSGCLNVIRNILYRIISMYEKAAYK